SDLLNVPSKQLIAQAQQLGFSVKNHMSTLGDSEARQLQGTTTVTHPKSQPAPAKTSRATQAVAKNVTRTANQQQSNSRHQQSGDSLNNNRNNNQNNSQSRNSNGNRS
ncbi:translation initiation factor IF-2 N-terminal domain-containing protein, partial [Klebsiella pneumoniae]|nr:translation initiation factor IF-2 N-terminal domain-containing protein [Klebsiella pneumoniae]